MKQLLVVAGDRALTKFVAETLLGRKVTPTEPQLTGNGWEIARAHSGLEAVLVATKGNKRFDAIVMDQHVPDRDVLQLLSEFRTTPAAEDIPIFIMSERGRDQLTRRLASDNYFVAGFIDKPVTAETLRRGLRNLRRMRLVLVVDSDKERAEDFAKSLRQNNYAVEIASKGKAAIKIVNNRRPDAVVSALKLKDVSGAEVCMRLKQQGATHSIPVLLHGEVKDLQESEIEENAHRADDFLGPALTGEGLVDRLSTLVGRGSSQISSAPPDALDPAGSDPMATKPLIDRAAVVEAAESAASRAPVSGEFQGLTPTGGTEDLQRKTPPNEDELLSTRPPGRMPSSPPASASPSTSDTKRSNRRVPCNLKVNVREGETIYTSKTLNISDGGILITTDHPLDIGAHIDLTLELPTTDEPISAVGKVAWFGSAPGTNGTVTGVGVKFSRIDPNDLKAIVDYVNHLSKLVYVAP